MFFDLNLKICRILQSTIRFYDLRSHLSPKILHKIPILTTLMLPIVLWMSMLFGGSVKFIPVKMNVIVGATSETI